MNKVRTAKVATVDELKAKVEGTSTAVVTEYRGMTVAEISTLRRQLRTLDADYKVFKNTLVRRAIEGTSVASLDEFLVGPTAIAFVNGDVSAVAKALRDFARATPTLIVKGGVLDGKPLSLQDLSALADLPSRDVLLARFAGLLASPLATMAGLLRALPQNFAYGLSALIDAKGGAVVAPVVEQVEETAETPAGVEEAAPAASDDDATLVADVADETPEAPVATEAPSDPETSEASEDVASEPAE
ncbi:MAG TPA: 50S ribosomal protein L10 [Acidimicrobiales bacterium]|nr:50S ribosomal protein L10 [Acidimicrobiales bacterium]